MFPVLHDRNNFLKHLHKKYDETVFLLLLLEKLFASSGYQNMFIQGLSLNFIMFRISQRKARITIKMRMKRKLRKVIAGVKNDLLSLNGIRVEYLQTLQ